MKTTAPSLNALWANLMIEELARLGIVDFVISPGSRSTPLTIAVARHEKARALMHFDERGAAFYALGLARGKRSAVALICTSGTAGAHYYPAVIEAYQDEVPLIILTADRPPELRHRGANQTIDQAGLYGSHVVADSDLPCPSEDLSPSWLLSRIDEMVHKSVAGPVHLNCPFREPLAPLGDDVDFALYGAPLRDWLEEDIPYKQLPINRPQLSPGTIDELADFLPMVEHGVIIAGRMTAGDATPVKKLAARLGWPLLPDIRSHLRLGGGDDVTAPYYDLALAANPRLAAPEAVLHVGGNVTSKRLLQWLEHHPPDTCLQVTPYCREYDPNHQVTTRFQTDIANFCDNLRRIIPEPPDGLPDRVQFADVSVLTIDNEIDKVLKSDRTLIEPQVARLISRHIVGDGALWLASSLPVREMDMFAAVDGPAVPVASNRGASGIDGTIASAVGFANGLKRVTTLLIGDLACLHDLNSLDLVRRSPAPVVMVILNNDGGGIFSMLPVAECTDVFEPYFATPHGMNFEAVAKQFNIAYARPGTADEFVELYRKGQRGDRSVIIEVGTSRDDTVRVIRQITDAVQRAMLTL